MPLLADLLLFSNDLHVVLTIRDVDRAIQTSLTGVSRLSDWLSRSRDLLLEAALLEQFRQEELSLVQLFRVFSDLSVELDLLKSLGKGALDLNDGQIPDLEVK